MAKEAKKAKKAKTAKRAAGKSPRAEAGVGKMLVVVESPAKIKSISKYLGSGYVVKASMGHVRDLPRKETGVDVKKNFAPTYVPLAGKEKAINELKKYVKTAPQVFLATDLDREGEAIAWHIAELFKLPASKVRRVIFNEITASAIRAAFEQAHELDINKVNAQQARRILDRLVGYEVSPLLWKKVAPGLSAGRVQTVAVRLIVEREKEIDAFTPEEYWRIGSIFTPDVAAAGDLSAKWQAFMAQRDAKNNPPTRDAQQAFLAQNGAFRAELVQWKGERFSADNADAAVEAARAVGLTISEVQRTDDPAGKGPAASKAVVIGALPEALPVFSVGEVKQRSSCSRPPAPFTTASMQQAASVKLRFGAARTMRVAQGLYEGVDLPDEGSAGLITYMRTDSTQLSAEALGAVREMIVSQFGPDYLPEKPNTFAAGKRAQEAHEAIRPTDPGRTPESIRGSLDDAQYKLYDLIWRRFVACQMTPAVWNVTDAEISTDTPDGSAVFKAVGRQLGFDGYLKVAGVPHGGEQMLPALETGMAVAPIELAPSQHFTQGPPRYTEASLVKAMEADGIGRPSTYASIIQTVQDREYAQLIERAFHPTHLGIVVTDKLIQAFPNVFDVRFTAGMEDRLDGVEDGRTDWVKVLKEFYGPFHKHVETAMEQMVHAQAESEPSDYTCEDCGKPMVYRFSKTGRYLACTGYPECKKTHPVDEDGKIALPALVDIACPECGKAMQLRKGRYGPFLSCATYPECKGVANLDRKGCVKLPAPPPLLIEDHVCPKCQAALNLRRGKRGPWLACSTFPKCRGRLAWTTLSDEQKKDLELRLMNHEKAHPVTPLKTLNGTVIGENHKPVDAPPQDKSK